jgi:hypothetical protein
VSCEIKGSVRSEQRGGRKITSSMGSTSCDKPSSWPRPDCKATSRTTGAGQSADRWVPTASESVTHHDIFYLSAACLWPCTKSRLSLPLAAYINLTLIPMCRDSVAMSCLRERASDGRLLHSFFSWPEKQRQKGAAISGDFRLTA